MATSTNVHGFNIGGNNNSFDQRGHFYRGVFSGNVTGMLVKQNTTPNMTVLVEHGSALLNKNTTSASIAEIKADTSVTIDTANTSNPRIDTVIIYEDTSVAIPTVEANYWQDGAGGRFKIVSLPGVAAASPVALTDASIQSAIGAGKPWARLADITVPTNSTTILNSNINNNVRTELSAKIADGAVTAAKIETQQAWQTVAYASGWGDYDAGTEWHGGRYMKDSVGIVHLAGLIKNTSGSTKTGGQLFTLPVGYRPLFKMRFTGASTGGGALIDVQPDGIVTTTASVLNGDWISLSNVSFKAG